MLGDRDDILYPARLVADTRLHLSTVMNGQYSEPFFVNMCKIVDLKIYLGYMTVHGKQIELAGIKDFFYNRLYGLGVRDMQEFLANISKLCHKDKSRTKYAYRFIEWLKNEDPIFKIPQEVFEYRRLVVSIKYMRASRKRRWWLSGVIKEMYEHYPHLLEQIGKGRKYLTIEECCYKEGVREKKERLKPISLYKEPTHNEVRELGRVLYQHLGKTRTRVLIATMLETYKAD
jgi:hypothetical protein